MCTSIVRNGAKTIVGWNLDILDMKHRVTPSSKSVYIEVEDEKEGWMPLFGANGRGDFVAMPTCWPFDERSNPTGETSENIIMLDIALLTGKRTFQETKERVEKLGVTSVPGVTFQAQLSDKNGNVLQVVPGQGYTYKKKPTFSVMTNFSPYKGDSEKHPWMGFDRFNTATKMLSESTDNFSVSDCFDILKAVAQTVCPTVVSMVFDVTDNIVYWCENQEFTEIKKQTF